MTRLAVDLATPADDAAIRKLLRTEPMPGRIQLTYEREPSFWTGCEVTGEDCRVLIARHEEDGDIVGLACRSTRNVFVNGLERRIGYLGQLRVDRRYRGRWLVSRGFVKLRELHESDPLPAYLASIIDGNTEATGVLVTKRRRGFPEFRAIADFRTLAIGVHRKKNAIRGDISVAAVNAGDLTDAVRFLNAQGPRRQFFSKWTEANLARLSSYGLTGGDIRVARRAGQMLGIAGLWDQSSYKQTVVQGYSGWMKIAAPLYNRAAPWLGRATLPRPGEKLKGAYVSLISIADDDRNVFATLLRELYNLAHCRGLSYILVGLDARDPLLTVASKYAHVVYPSRLHLAEWSDGGRIDEQLDGRPVYVDIATL